MGRYGRKPHNLVKSKPKAHPEARTETDGEVRSRSFYLSGSGMLLLAYLAAL
jgi:hypothetical protein